MSRGRLQVGIDDATERHQIVDPPQAAATGDALEVVDAPQRCPGNRYADERCGVCDVADKRNTPHGHQVVDLEFVAAERVERMCDAEPSNIARRLITACIPGQSTTRCARASSRPSSGELLDRRSLPTVREARREVFRFIEGFYNTSRLPLGPRLPGACELRGNQPCRVKRPRARATDGPRPLSPPWEGTTGFISDTINHRSQLSVKAGQVQGPPSRVKDMTPESWTPHHCGVDLRERRCAG